MSPPVLIVEDDHATLTLLEAVLRHNAIDCESAGDGDAALSKLTCTRYGAVLLDLLLPGTDGFGILREIKDIRPELLPKIIVVTAAADAIWRASAELRLVRCVMRKPVDINDLILLVRGCLDEGGDGQA